MHKYPMAVKLSCHLGELSAANVWGNYLAGNVQSTIHGFVVPRKFPHGEFSRVMSRELSKVGVQSHAGLQVSRCRGCDLGHTHRQTHTQTDTETNKQTAFDRLDLTAACNNP